VSGATQSAGQGGRGPTGRRLGQLLLAEGVITAEQLNRALEEQTRSNDRLGAVLVRLGLLVDDQLADFLSRVHGIPLADLSKLTIDPEVVRLVPARIARRHEVVAIDRTGGSLTLATADPQNLPALDDVAFVSGLRVVPVVATSSAIRRAIEQCYEAPDLVTMSGVETSEIELLPGAEPEGPVDVVELKASADQPPVVRLVNVILLDAVRRGASDIHLHPSETVLRVRYRVDGMLYEAHCLPKRFELPVVSRIKIMANLDIAERRLPQDGRINLRRSARDIDLRVNTLPTVVGESVSIRILDRQKLKLDLAQLGFDPWGLEQFQEALRSTKGMILVTGPTGSGKTTTLYSALQSLNSVAVNIVTVEDPVEYRMERIIQIAVNEEIGRTFASVLRAFLRHDPDVVLVGEMRDLETAQIAIQAALTGHLVLSTLHTNDGVSTIARLLDMNVPAFLLASTLRLIVAQRLARMICVACREPYEVDAASLVLHGHTPQARGPCLLYRGKGCRACNFTGMKGRVALYEVMPFTEEIRDLISGQAPISRVREAARQRGVKTLREAGLTKVMEGIVTLEEVVRVTAE